ncbi:hypothetical protein SASPL_113231 [Salvia splendens]|uniref:Amino acid transporter transmembrane domain-containing protein n=1 Tax=Salvia splendens TaxID=180675 RepID=A0A8X9A0V7_SALSN|nr:hypothetical protein SASPL_113231 [Salvia splendens]
MALVPYTISLHDNLANVFTAFTLSSSHLSASQLLALIAVLVALPSLWLRDLSSISFLSSAGVLSLLIFTSVAYTAVSGAIRALLIYIPVLHLSKIPAISGLYVFSFAGHIVFPNLYNSINDPSKFTKVCIHCELLNGDSAAMQLEQSLPPSFKSRTRMIIRGAVGSILLLIILVLALSVPYFEHVLSLTGSLVSVGICIIFPCAFYSRIFWRQISTRQLLLNLVLITFGATLGAFGTFSSSRSLIISLQRGHTS